MFEETFRRGLVQVPAMMEVVVYLLFVEQFGATLVMKGDVGKAAQVVP